MKNVRMQMLNGEQPISCIKCYKEENIFIPKRMWETEYWYQKGLIPDKIIENTKEDGSVILQILHILIYVLGQNAPNLHV